MADEKVMMPTSTAGLTRYFDDYKSKIEFSPGQIIILTVIVLAITLVLHLYGNIVLGIV